MADRRLPITVVTGFLGSGKTTLLANVLKDERFRHTAAIINEFGEAGLDHRLIRRVKESTRLLSGGCICCNMREDLIAVLKEILNEYERGETVLDRIVIETTGLADPAPILFSVLMDPLLSQRYYVSNVVCCLDAVNGSLHLRNHAESLRQIVAADTVVITKTDMVDAAAVAEMHARLCRLNPAASVRESAYGGIDPSAVFGTHEASARKNEARMAELPPPQGMHDNTVRSMSIRFDAALDWTSFGLWLSMLLYTHGEKMLRVKGIVDVGEQGPIVINGVQHVIHPPQHLPDWRGEERSSQIVFIMKDLQPQDIMASLTAFQNILGAAPIIEEINANPYGNVHEDVRAETHHK